ncbi:hypothetical protein G6F58_013746 [Rhizopus delemar]|nr:hypothetical protein G6F58_013746 [Rhizopus delemar]
MPASCAPADLLPTYRRSGSLPYAAAWRYSQATAERTSRTTSPKVASGTSVYSSVATAAPAALNASAITGASSLRCARQ